MTASRKHKNTQKAWIFLGLLSLCSVSYSPAHAQSREELDNRLNRVENEIQTLSRSVFKGEAPPPGTFAGPSSDDMANATIRMDQLETEIRDLTGKIEEQNNQIDQLKSQLEKMSAGMNNAAAASNPGPTRYTTIPADTPPAPEPAVNQGTGDILRPPPPPEAGPGGQYQWSSDNPPTEPAPGTLGTLGSAPAANDAGAMAYENAFALLKNGQYDAAEQGFQSFLTQYPSHQLVGNAKYWLGESFYARGQYDKASRTFAQAYQENPKGPKAPDNLLKLGLSLGGLGKKEDACIALGQIEKEFATTAGPVLRRAKQEMTHFGCT